MKSVHEPVLLQEAVATLTVKLDGHYLDATFGDGGHTRGLLAKLDPQARILAIDRDEEAIQVAQELAAEDPRVQYTHGRFSQLETLAQEAGFSGFDGILMDVGLSSSQLDDPQRGFSFLKSGPLDMRMDTSSGATASEWLNSAELVELSMVLKRYGEERNARNIARAIVAARPLNTTSELVDAIRAATPIPDRRKHVATRVFQAVRMQVNDELNELRLGLRQAFDLLKLHGRLAVITFHSLEHGHVRRQFSDWTTDALPRRIPIQGDRAGPAKIILKAKRPNRAEVQRNVRARSAMLQVIERVK